MKYTVYYVSSLRPDEKQYVQDFRSHKRADEKMVTWNKELKHTYGRFIVEKG